MTGNADRTISHEEILSSIADVLLVLSNVGMGDYSMRLDVDSDEAHPLTGLFEGINEMIRSLERERSQAEAYQTELEEKLATIEIQRAAIRDLSTPIMEVWDGVLCLPVVGVMDTARSADMTNELLQAVSQKQTRCAIIDITGIDVMDTSTAQHFIRMAKSVRMLGAQCLLTGINPSIAQTIIHMGIDLTDIATHQNLRDALQEYVVQEAQARRAREAVPGARGASRLLGTKSFA